MMIFFHCYLYIQVANFLPAPSYWLKHSKLLGKISQKDIERIRQFLERINICLQPQDSIDKEELYEAMLIDKKKRGNSLNFIVLEEIGKAKLVNEIPKDIVLEAIEVTL